MTKHKTVFSDTEITSVPCCRNRSQYVLCPFAAKNETNLQYVKQKKKNEFACIKLY